jgi:hypothetical protein
MLPLMYCVFFVLSSAYTWTEIACNGRSIMYSREEMEEHKNNCIKKMQSNTWNLKDPTYQMQRALQTISGDDADYIPKIVGAGEIFNDGIFPYQLMHNGVKIILNSYYDTQWIADVIYGLKGHHEPQEEKCFYEVLKYIPENATMIELGSYWAYYSLWFAFEIKGAKNYLIEPDFQRLEIGRRNFELNNKAGNFRRGFAGIMIDSEAKAHGAQYIAIDNFIESEGIEHVHILHADIQGAEFEMLKTTLKYLHNIDYFFISTHGPQCHLPCLQFFKEHGFVILAETNADCGVNDGLIVAKRKDVAGPEQISIRKY